MTKNIYNILIFGFFLTLISSCEVEPEQTPPDRSYELVWSDEFDGDSGTTVDPAKWAFDLGTGENGWGNNELQSYTNDPANIAHDGKGNLVITAIKAPDGRYTSARIKTKGLFSQKYGRFEARIKTPAGAGMWPAFWMLGENIDEVSWPQCGEIDIMEQKGNLTSITYGSLHGPGYSAGEAITTPYGLQNDRFDSDFYVYAVEWGEDYIDFFVGDYLYKRVVPSDVPGEWVYDQPFFLLLNLAVGGTFGGPPNDFTPFPSTMEIDYVKVYKEN
jgi:beta-glucanase (GH16 family)